MQEVTKKFPPPKKKEQLRATVERPKKYLAMTVKTKAATLIHLFNLYVLPIRSSDFHPHPSSYPHPLQPLFSVILTAITHPGTLTALRIGSIQQRFV